MFNIVIRGFSLIIFCTLFGYWYLASIIAQEQKPRTKQPNPLVYFLRMTTNWASLIAICIQLIGWHVFQIPEKFQLLAQLIGVVLLVIGFIICVFARKSLGANWTPGFMYQIKQKHTLVTTGIYQYIRHPIYIGLFLVFVGVELVAQSLLWISFLVIILPLYLQSKKEEKLLLSYFGENYKKYQTKTKMFIPFIW